MNLASITACKKRFQPTGTLVSSIVNVPVGILPILWPVPIVAASSVRIVRIVRIG